MPTRNARNGTLFTTQGRMNILNARWTEDLSPVDPGLDGYASQRFSKAYLRHLFKANEILALQLATLQNLALYRWVMREARAAIQEDRFAAWRRTTVPQLQHRL